MLNARSQQDIQRMEAKRQYARERYRMMHTLKSKEDSIKCDCENCDGWYLPKNKFQHEQTKKHMRAYAAYRFKNPGKR